MRAVASIGLSVIALANTLAQRPAPAPPQTGSMLVKNGTVHVGNGLVIDEGAVGFRDGRIDYVGYTYGVSAAYDSTIDAKGQHVYPGLIVPDATLGLHEIDLVRATADEDEVGEMEPEGARAHQLQSDSRIIPTVRNNGVLIGQITPQGGTLSGTSAIVQFDAWDWEDAAVRAADGVHLEWPRSFTRSGWWAERGETTRDKDEERRKKLDEIRRFFEKAKAYHEQAARPVVDLRMEAMRGLFSGTQTLFVHANRVREIQEAVLFAKDLGIKRTVIVGGYDAWRVADLLRDNKVDVILMRLHSLPLREEDDVDLPFRLPALLKERGIRFCLGYSGGGDMDRIGSRNLAFIAGTAAAYGLSDEEALQAVTLDAARILGIDKDYGSLEVGKSATLFISTGDALDMRTNNVVQAFIQGRHISLDDHQKQLYRMYEAR
jgi:imidazolonepropionase-like amidohydrolase